MMVAMTLAGQGSSGFAIRSAAFQANAAIPSSHTCDDADTSPALEWSGEPPETKSFALVVHDPDAPAGEWLHWTAWNIPPATHALAADVPKRESLPDGTRQGRNDFGKPGYGGPCPPSGTHRYVFELYALDAMLNLPATASRRQIEQAIQEHHLSRATLTGTYKRAQR